MEAPFGKIGGFQHQRLILRRAETDQTVKSTLNRVIQFLGQHMVQLDDLVIDQIIVDQYVVVF